MTYKLRISRDARRYLERLDPDAQDRVNDRFAQLLAEPYNRQHSKALGGQHGLRTARAGGWRLVFAVDERAQTVTVERIGPRGQVYRNL